MAPLRSRLLAALLLAASCDDAPAKAPAEEEQPQKAQRREQTEALLGALSSKAPATRPEKEGKRRPKSILLAEARELVEWRVADGFLDRAAIVALAMDAADARESLRGEVERLVDDALAAHRAREAEWRFLTDADRLSRAFAALERQGVIARERFSDCRKCGVAEMKLVREDLLEKGRRADGYVFFTDQDADGVSESGELVLEYGSFREDAQASRALGEKIAAALRSEGLSPVAETDDEASAYLVLADLEWQKRRFTRPPAR
ncbi:MAG: hypothetical protein IAE78_30260 [Myxococcus sp.]|nr:hypothetical protein [Myxococcus sp.]